MIGAGLSRIGVAAPAAQPNETSHGDDDAQAGC